MTPRGVGQLYNYTERSDHAAVLSRGLIGLRPFQSAAVLVRGRIGPRPLRSAAVLIVQRTDGVHQIYTRG